MTENRFIHLISCEFSGDITPEELEELTAMLKNDSLLQKKYVAFREMRLQHERDTQPNIELALQKVLNNIQQNNTGKYPAKKKSGTQFVFIKLGSMAAAALLLMVTGYLFLAKKTTGTDAVKAFLNAGTSHLVEKQNNEGMRSLVALSDGTKIWLNADSKLDYPKVFEGITREVYLSGEAFFEVAKNPARPFIIHLDEGTVRVLGTSFNIKAYKDSKVVETSVSTGRVAFIPAKKNILAKGDTTFLTHDVKAVYRVETGEISTLTTVSGDDKAWTNGKMIFKNLTFEDIATELERTFGKKVVFADEDVKHYRLTGSFENNSPDEILYYLSLSKPFTYKMSNEEIVISKVGSDR